MFQEVSGAGKCIPLNRPNYSPVVNQQKSDLLVDCLDIGMAYLAKHMGNGHNKSIRPPDSYTDSMYSFREGRLECTRMAEPKESTHWHTRENFPSLSSPKKIGKVTLGMSQHRLGLITSQLNCSRKTVIRLILRSGYELSLRSTDVILCNLRQQVTNDK